MAPGLTRLFFHERMQGPVARGVADPLEGAAKGREAGTALVLDLDVQIEDLDACLADPRHPARLGGMVSLTGVAEKEPIEAGTLEMYVPSLSHGAKLMGYYVRFRDRDGTPYLVTGQKIIHTPWPSVREQVTLLTEIRQDEERGRLWGSGVLVFRLRDLPAFWVSMRAEGSSRWSALWRFLQFARREVSQPPRFLADDAPHDGPRPSASGSNRAASGA